MCKCIWNVKNVCQEVRLPNGKAKNSKLVSWKPSQSHPELYLYKIQASYQKSKPLIIESNSSQIVESHACSHIQSGTSINPG